MPGVSRLRAPAAPSITPLVLGISTAIVALMIEFVAVLAYRSSSTAADAAVSVFMQHLAVAVSVFAVVPAIVAIVFFVRYRRTLMAFTLAVQQFRAERNHASEA
jgi:chromate transport protein ChrA